jgi:toxin HigB-1
VSGIGFDTRRLTGTDPARYGMSVSGPWRITFEFSEGSAFRVDLEQYH